MVKLTHSTKKSYAESMPHKTLVVCNFPRFSLEIWLPYLWFQSKSYYEQFGQRQDEWKWYPCYADLYDQDHIKEIKQQILTANPSILAFSLYVWNFQLSMQIAEWAKQTLPDCLIITGGPHQYEKHDLNWFKEHWYIDASLPSDSYGELCFQEILDNYIDGKVDFNTVSDIRYPKGKDRISFTSKKTLNKSDKSKFYYDYSIFSLRQEDLQDFIAVKEIQFPQSKLLSVIETTRGCPYGCTYCDWGGGIKTKVIKKNIATVKKDIDVLMQLDLSYIYFSDANFGIFGDRDVEIIKYFVKTKKAYKSIAQLGWGGLAKTENKLETLKELIKLDIENNLGNQAAVKLSVQTLDRQVLKNIDREDIPFELQMSAFKPLTDSGKIPMYAEIIMGLPGMTLPGFYKELDQFGQHELPVYWYEWILLPEAPAYSKEYRNQYNIQSVLKTNGWYLAQDTYHAEVVVSAQGYSTDDYLEMLLAGGLYSLILQGGFFKNTVDHILNNYNIKLGELCRTIIQDQELTSVKSAWQTVLTDPKQSCITNVAGYDVPILYYFTARAFYCHNDFTVNLAQWFINKFQIPLILSSKDVQLSLNNNNFNQKIRHGLTWIDYTKTKKIPINSFEYIVSSFRRFTHAGEIMRGKQKFLNLIPN